MSDRVPSLRELDRLEDRIRQHRQVATEPILIVEGPDDELVLGVHVSAKIFPADGKVNALRAARAITAWGIGQFVVVIDRDFDDASALSDLESCLHPYSRRDLESMLISLDVLTSVIRHQGSSKKLEQCGGPDAVLALLEPIALTIATLRYENARGELGLSFDMVDPASKMDTRTLKFNLYGFCTALVAASDTRLTSAQVSALASSEPPDGLGACGKDVVAIAGVALRHVAGSLPLAACSANLLISQLHSSSGLPLSKSQWMRELTERLAA